MHLLFITFGPNERNHLQAYFSIYSFLARKALLKSINVITDQPSFYKVIEKHVNIIPVNEQILNDWKGPHSFFWRIKLKGIERLCRDYPGEPILYLDTDTLLYGDFSKALELISNKQAGMHENEGSLTNIGTKSALTLQDNLKNITFEKLPPLGSYDMWNAGAVLIPNAMQGKDIDMALRLCDRMLSEHVAHIFIEQFALGICLKEFYGLQPLSPFIGHYWSNKDEWNEVINRFFIGNKLKGVDEDEMLERFKEIDFSKIPIKRIKKNTNVRLKKVIDKYFPDKFVSYLGFDSE